MLPLTFLYGSESWVLKVMGKRRVEVTDMKDSLRITLRMNVVNMIRDRERCGNRMGMLQ